MSDRYELNLPRIAYNKGVVIEDLSLYNVSMHKENDSVIQPLNASNEVGGGITTKPYPTCEVKDLIHNTQEIDKKNCWDK